MSPAASDVLRVYPRVQAGLPQRDGGLAVLIRPCPGHTSDQSGLVAVHVCPPGEPFDLAAATQELTRRLNAASDAPSVYRVTYPTDTDLDAVARRAAIRYLRETGSPYLGRLNHQCLIPDDQRGDRLPAFLARTNAAVIAFLDQPASAWT